MEIKVDNLDLRRTLLSLELRLRRRLEDVQAYIDLSTASISPQFERNREGCSKAVEAMTRMDELIQDDLARIMGVDRGFKE